MLIKMCWHYNMLATDKTRLVEKVLNTKANTEAHQAAGLVPTSLEDAPSLEPALNQEKQADKGCWGEGENSTILRFI